MKSSTGAIIASLGVAALAYSHQAGAVTFSTFVAGPAIAAVESGYDSTIGFNYTGTGFIGSVYLGTNNTQLYSTDLTGGNVQLFGTPMPATSGEIVVAAGLGHAGFQAGDVYAGAANNIYHYASNGGSPALFASTPDGSTVRQILIDPGTSFGGNMLVTTTSGLVLKVTSGGAVTTVVNLHADTEGMDIVGGTFGQYQGNLLVASEGTGLLHLISPTGTVTTVNGPGSNPISIALAEAVSYLPTNLGASGNPVEGLYEANFKPFAGPNYGGDIQYAGPSQFAGLLGDAIITSEYTSSSPVYALSYNGDIADNFSLASVGTLPDQAEDSILVTAERLSDIPEPASLALLGSAFAGQYLAQRRRRRRRDA